MGKGQRNSSSKTLDPLSEYFTPKNATSRDKVTCVFDNCGASFTRKSNFRYHFKTSHVAEWKAFNDRTEQNESGRRQEESRTQLEYERFISQYIAGVEFTWNTARLFDVVKNRPRLTFVKLDGSVLDKKDLGDTIGISPIVDNSLDTANQMTKYDYLNLPNGHVMGHMIPTSFFFHDVPKWLAINKYSICVIQNEHLNDGYWSKLEDFAKNSTSLGFVRVVVIPQGDLKVEGLKSRSVPPKFLYILIVCSDTGDKNWRYAAYKMPNEECHEGLNSYKITIDGLRKETGFDLFNCVFPASEVSVEPESNAGNIVSIEGKSYIDSDGGFLIEITGNMEVDDELACDETVPDNLYTSSFTPYDHIMYLEKQVAVLKAKLNK